MSPKERYRQLCKKGQHTEIPVFLLPFWLDAVAENWDVCLYEEHNKILAVLPYCWKGIFFSKRIYLPDLSFYQSPIIFDLEEIDANKKQAIIHHLFTQLPLTIRSYFKFIPNLYSIDISVEGYKKDDYYTYIIEKHQATKPMSQHHQRYIQKGINQGYSIAESEHIEKSYALIKSTFDRQYSTVKINLTEFKSLVNTLKQEQKGKVIDCIDRNNNILGSILLVSDEKTSYYLMSGYNESFKNSGAIPFLLHHHIQECAKKKIDFNFCGSTKESIANFFEGFGANKVPVAIWKKQII